MAQRADRGSQYVSILYTERLAQAGIEPSVGSRGDSYDNALAETINGLYMRISAMAATDFNLIADSVSLRRRTAFHRDRGHRRGRPSDRADVSAGGYRGG
jgi:transposase InsO family protein